MNKSIDFDKFRTKAQKVTVEPSRKKPNISDDDIKKMFYAAEDKWYTLEDLNEIIGEVITVTVNNPKRTPINSRYLKRMSNLTDEIWRQQTAISDGKRLVRFTRVGKKK
jgi:hypothetical protein